MARRYFLDYLILTSWLVAGQSVEYALKGGEVFLSPDIRGHPDGILWKHNGNKVVEFNGQEQVVYSPFDNRITLDWVSAKLHITDLRFDDSGDYELEVEINKRFQRLFYELKVIDKVAKLTISCEMNEGSSSNMSGTLECSAESAQLQSFMQFGWIIHGSVQPGPKLPISLGDEHDDEVYSCIVSNQLISETATFTAKDCYADKKGNPSVGLIVGLVILGIVFVVLCILVIYCRRYSKACFAKDDLESRNGPTEGSDKKTAQGYENDPLIARAPTLPSTRPLHHANAHYMDAKEETPQKAQFLKTREIFEQNKGGQMPTEEQTESNTDEHEETASPPSPPRSESPSLDLNNPARNDEGDEDADQHREPVPQCGNSDSEKENEPDPAGASDDLSVSPLKTDVQFPVAPAQPEPEKEADEDEEAQSAPASAETSSSAQPHSPLTETSPNMAPSDTAGEHKEDANSDQVSGETAEKNVRESESSGEEGERNESDDSGEDKLSSAVPERKNSGTLSHERDLNLSQPEKNTREDNQQETAKPVSEDENETDEEETDKEQDLYLAASQQPESPISTKPDNRNTEAFQEAPDSPDREEERKTSHDSDEPGGQSDKGEGETDEDQNEVQCGLKEEEPGSESLSEDKEGQQKDKIVA